MEQIKIALEQLGLKNLHNIHANLPIEKLIEHQLERGESVLGMNGAVMVETGAFTGRSPKDKFFVEEDCSKDNIWWGATNQKVSQETFDILKKRVADYLSDNDIYVYEGFCGADKNYRLPIRVATKFAWHSHFCDNMFITAEPEEMDGFEPEFTILNAAGYLEKDFEKLGLNSEVFVIFNLKEKLAIVGGTEYSGEIKKGIFSVMNYLLPLEGIMPMHCSANVDKNGDVALFFGLSGTGKTTLSTDPNRELIGDDEHGWSDDGVFNFEGGCYAKCLGLDSKKEPDIWNAIKFHAILENVVYDENRVVDFDDASKTQNSRVSYPLSHIENTKIPSVAGHPTNIIFLTADAFGILPPVSRLTPEQASYHFLTGYTAKLAGTERGVDTPQAVFSTCFGGPFMTLHPSVYGELLAEKMQKHDVKTYLVNTGWTGGAYGEGSRISLPDTRAIINYILDGTIEKCSFDTDPVFGFEIPDKLYGIDAKIMHPRETWHDKAEYDKARIELAKMFIENFKQYADHAPHLEDAGPKIESFA